MGTRWDISAKSLFSLIRKLYYQMINYNLALNNISVVVVVHLMAVAEM